MSFVVQSIWYQTKAKANNFEIAFNNRFFGLRRIHSSIITTSLLFGFFAVDALALGLFLACNSPPPANCPLILLLAVPDRIDDFHLPGSGVGGLAAGWLPKRGEVALPHLVVPAVLG